MVTIDVVIPSFRLLSQYLIPIIEMEVPADAAVRYLIISDDPSKKVPQEILSRVDNKKLFLFRNDKNYGVCRTRNVGIDNAKADWILFLDDDVIPDKNLLKSYTEAIKQNPEEVGFIGEVIFPAPVNAFTKAIISSGITNLFSLVKQDTHSIWAPTANIIVKRSVIGDTRFDEVFPAAGAGEELDFFINIYNRTHKKLLCINSAKVYHDWWGGGKRNYVRFMRWANGTGILHNMHPEYTYYSFPNIAEVLLLGTPVLAALCTWKHNWLPLIAFILGTIVADFLGEFVRQFRKKGPAQSLLFYEISIFRACSDIARLAGQFTIGNMPKGICQRFDYLCNGKSLPDMRFWAGVKFLGFIVAPLVLYYGYEYFILHK